LQQAQFFGAFRKPLSLRSQGRSTSMSSQSRAISNPLLYEGLLELALTFVGGGEALYMRAVNSSWKAGYDKLTAVKQNSSKHVHTSTCTSYQAVFESAARVRLAFSKLPLQDAAHTVHMCAGKYADIETLRAAHALGLLFLPQLILGAASSRCLSKIQWLHVDQRCPLPDGVTAVAAKAGNLEQLKWLHAHGAAVNSSTAVEASLGGAVHVFEWLQQQGIVFTESSMNCAAMYGQLQLCQWLHAQQCPWSDMATDAAAFNDRGATLRWLIESGCPYTAEGVCIGVVSCFQDSEFSTLQYLYEQGILATPAMLTLALNVAGSLQKLEAAQWLRQRGAEWPAVLRCTVLHSFWHGSTLAWARVEGCTAPTEPVM
jgi:hypothetical protein